MTARIGLTERRMGASRTDVTCACLQAARWGFAFVSVNPVYVALCASLLADTSVRVDAAVGFPTGGFTTANKVFEAQDALQQGAEEIGFVVNIAALRGGDRDSVRTEMLALREATEGHVVKAILEVCLLTDREKEDACRLAAQSGLDFVVTSTGVSPGGPTVRDVRLMRSVVGDKVLVEASGWAWHVREVEALLQAGAARVGTGDGRGIIRELQSPLR